MLRDLSLSMIAEMTQGKIVQGEKSILCDSVSTDTRTLQPGSLYIPLSGENFDGHDFINLAQEAGAVASLVERDIESTLPLVRVENTLLALGQIAAWHRSEFKGPLISVTGSAGKTSVKELTANVLSQIYNTWMTQGNLNNHIGAPLTLLSLKKEHRAAVIELGASGLGEIAYTAQFVRPLVGIITNVGEAHLEGFGSVEGIASTKGELIDWIQANGTAVLNQDDQFIGEWKERASHLNIVTFGLNSDADVFATDIQLTGQGVFFVLNAECQSFPVRLSLLGVHNVRNALAVAAATRSIGMDWSDIIKGLESAESISGRLHPRKGASEQMIFDDAYNANPSSFKAAIDVLSKSASSWLVMGDMGELGEDEIAMHKEVGEYAKQSNIRQLVATGKLSKYAVEAFGDNGRWFATTQEAIEFLQASTGQGDTLLVKGSRSARMDQVVTALTDKDKR